MRTILISAILVTLAACKPGNQPASSNDTSTAEVAQVRKGIDRSHKGQPFPDAKFLQDDEDGAGEMDGDALKGEPVLVNFWASWCAPCIKELPTLKTLAQSQAFPGAVIALNQDNGPQASVRAFLAKHGVEELGNYQDPKMAVSGALQVQVLPTTILFDSDGREVWRYVGELDWTDPEAAKLLAEAGAAKPR